MGSRAVAGLGGEAREAGRPEARTLCAGWDRGPVHRARVWMEDPMPAVCSGRGLGVT